MGSEMCIRDRDSVAKGKTDSKEKAIFDLVDITKQHQTSGAKEGASKRKLVNKAGRQTHHNPDSHLIL